MSRRHLYLVRHGQYNPKTIAPDEFGTGLTALGKRQARVTAKVFSRKPITSVHYSTMRRAAETADIIIEHAFPDIKQSRSRRLWERLPCIPDTFGEDFWIPDNIHEQQELAEDAYAHYFRPTRGEPKHEVLITHANMIRYFVCRVLNVNPGAWLNMECHNCGITRVNIAPDGMTTLISFNDIGHLSANLRTDNFHII